MEALGPVELIEIHAHNFVSLLDKASVAAMRRKAQQFASGPSITPGQAKSGCVAIQCQIVFIGVLRFI